MNVNLNEIVDYIQGVIDEAQYDETEYSFVDICLYGSRLNGNFTCDSDLDVLVEYRGTAREDDIFNLLHSQDYFLNGMLLDINPIKADKSGTIQEYLLRCDVKWKEK